MRIGKLTDAYCYLALKGQNHFEDLALKMLWMADKASLSKYARTISGELLPITELPALPVEECSGCKMLQRVEARPCKWGPFGNLSRSDMMTLDRIFLDFEAMTDEQQAAFEIHKYSTLEEFFEGHEHAKDMIEEIREHEWMENSMRAAGFFGDDGD